MNAIFTRIAVGAFVLSAFTSAANAGVYAFDYEADRSALRLAGQIHTASSGEVTAMSGVLSGSATDTIGAMIVNPNSPAPTLSTDGAFVYDNAFYGPAAPLDVYGLLFTTLSLGGYWNLWDNGSDYSLWQSIPGRGYTVETSGRLTITAVPEAPTWTMAVAGFAFLGYAAFRRSPREPAIG